MNCLSDLKELFVANGYKIKRFVGYELLVGKDIYGMYDGEFFKNYEKVNEKELIASIKNKNKKKK